MISFNRGKIWNLKIIKETDVNENVKKLLLADEFIIGSFKTIRDQLVFTNKRIISLDIQGVTGKKKSLCTLPYSTIQYFTIQTSGFLELLPDNELFIAFANGMTATYEFKDNCDILEIGKAISEYTLRK